MRVDQPRRHDLCGDDLVICRNGKVGTDSLDLAVIDEYHAVLYRIARHRVDRLALNSELRVDLNRGDAEAQRKKQQKNTWADACTNATPNLNVFSASPR